MFIIVYKLDKKAQLSQRDHAILRVTEYFAKSLKVTRGRRSK